ncbi:hypothetical protein LJC47_06855, partial [Desulfosarcina sp. OttesenSCG-928-B08]|nr:hypothetical protein [Desulfosarcina sp. OttesenSCG-928-B08]
MMSDNNNVVSVSIVVNSDEGRFLVDVGITGVAAACNKSSLGTVFSFVAGTANSYNGNENIVLSATTTALAIGVSEYLIAAGLASFPAGMIGLGVGMYIDRAMNDPEVQKILDKGLATFGFDDFTDGVGDLSPEQVEEFWDRVNEFVDNLDRYLDHSNDGGAGDLSREQVEALWAGVGEILDRGSEGLGDGLFADSSGISELADGIGKLADGIVNWMADGLDHMLAGEDGPGGNLTPEEAQKIQDDFLSLAKKLLGLLGNLGLSSYDDFLNDIQGPFNQAKKTASPLILDLDGDGIETIGLSSGVYFDHDGNGFAQKSGWVGSSDGLLVLDLNENGRIDDGTELFGSNTLLTNGKAAANGFAALKAFDANKDGIIDASDEVFSQLRIWKDINANGHASEGELFALESLGIQSLNLTYATQSLTDAQGNQHRQIGSYTLTDGTVREMTDVWFAQDTARTVETDLVEVSEGIAALANVRGFGNVHSLHQAMARSEDGRLQTLVQSFSEETDPTVRDALATEIIYVWSGVENIDPRGRGSYIDDARKVAALEMFLGEKYSGNTEQNASALLMKAFDELVLYVSSQLMSQTHLIPFLNNIKLNIYMTDDIEFSVNVDDAVSLFNAAYSANTENALSLFSSFTYILKNSGEIGERVLNSLADAGRLAETGMSFFFAVLNYPDAILGDDGNNTLSGGAGNDTILGGA